MYSARAKAKRECKVNRKIKIIAVTIAIVAVVSIAVFLYRPPSQIGNSVYNANTGLSYVSIQAAVDAAETKDGHTLIVYPGVYHESLVVNKSLQIIGYDRDTTIMERGKSSVIIVVIFANETTFANMTLRNTSNAVFALRLINTRDCSITGNKVTNLTTGIQLDYSTSCVVEGNEIVNGGLRGIWLFGSNDNTITKNTIQEANKMMGYGAINLERSDNNTIIENQVVNNTYAVWFDTSSHNTIVHNNFVNNTSQVHSGNLPNAWDNGREGNYWSDYTGTDGNGDGIGDIPYIIDSNNSDTQPFVRPMSLDDQ